NLWATGHFMG
nr:Chain L, NMB30 [Homo sapiens]